MGDEGFVAINCAACLKEVRFKKNPDYNPYIRYKQRPYCCYDCVRKHHPDFDEPWEVCRISQNPIGTPAVPDDMSPGQESAIRMLEDRAEE